MSLPFTIYSAQDWLSSVPPLLLSEEKSSELTTNEEAQEYLASTLIKYFQYSQESFLESIVSILEGASDSGKYIMIKVLFRSESLWNDFARKTRLRAALSELALLPDKVYTQDANSLSKKLMDLTFYSTRRDEHIEATKEEEKLEEVEPELKRSMVFPSPQPTVERVSVVGGMKPEPEVKQEKETEHP